MLLWALLKSAAQYTQKGIAGFLLRIMFSLRRHKNETTSFHDLLQIPIMVA